MFFSSFMNTYESVDLVKVELVPFQMALVFFRRHKKSWPLCVKRQEWKEKAVSSFHVWKDYRFKTRFGQNERGSLQDIITGLLASVAGPFAGAAMLFYQYPSALLWDFHHRHSAAQVEAWQRQMLDSSRVRALPAGFNEKKMRRQRSELLAIE